jgi:transcriptional regulator with XRE-family HTH domain
MKDRIAHILKTKNLTATKFADDLDVQRSGISHILSGRNNPSLDFVIKIKETYPEFSLDWLLMGKGPATISPTDGPKQMPKDYLLFDQRDESNVESFQNRVAKAEPDDSNERKQENIEGRNQDMAAQSGQGQVGSNTKIPSELTVQKGLDGDKHPKIARIIVFYEDKTFDSYNPVE